MAAQDQSWTVRHFALANPRGPNQGDVPALLRRLAETLTSYGAVHVQDIVFHLEMDEDGNDWPSAIVYFHESSPADQRK
jgi:hypothetical protein